MNSLDTMITFFGWCSIINIGLLIFTAVLIIFLKTTILMIHAKIFHLKEDEISIEYFRYLAQYKILVIVFNIVPYFALLIMS